MPKMKFFQAIADIKRHYDTILENFDNPRFGHSLLASWGINLDEKHLIIEEHEALRYLVGCQINMVRDTNAKKPSIDVMNRCLERHLRFLETIHKCHAFNVNKHPSSLVQKEYKACRHYLFKFSLPAWYEKMPAEILTFENKHPNFNW